MSDSTRRDCLRIVLPATLGALAAAPATPDPNEALARGAAQNRRTSPERPRSLEQERARPPGQRGCGPVGPSARFEALRAAHAEKQETIDAIKQYLEQLKLHEEVAKRAFEHGIGAGMTLHDVRYERLKAEMWLNQEQARS